MNSVSWFGHFPHRLSVGLSVGLLRAAAGFGLPARAFLNLQIGGLLPPGSVSPFPRHLPKSQAPFWGGAVVGNALQPFPRIIRETSFPTRKAASLKADGHPRRTPTAEGRLPTADSPPWGRSPTSPRGEDTCRAIQSLQLVSLDVAFHPKFRNPKASIGNKSPIAASPRHRNRPRYYLKSANWETGGTCIGQYPNADSHCRNSDEW